MKALENVATVLALLRDPVFIELRRKADQKALLWRDFKDMTMPSGYSPEDTWAILTAIRKQTALTLPIHAYYYGDDEKGVWYLIDHATSATLKEIESIAHLDFDDQAKGAENKYLLTSGLALDLSDAARRDGIDISQNEVLELLLGKRIPNKPEEQLTHSVYELLLTIENYAEYRLTPWILEDIVTRLSRKCEDLPYNGVYRYKTGDFPLKQRYRNTTPHIIQEHICLVANREQADPLSHPLIELTLMSNYFWDLLPLKKWNGLVELIVRHIMLMKSGYTLIRWVPLSHLNRQWEQGVISPPQVCCKLFDLDPDIGEGLDCTTRHRAHMELILLGLRQLQDATNQQRLENEAATQAIETIPYLNYRQRDILRTLASNPSITLKIGPHMKLYRVAYATARNDFLDLNEREFLQYEYVGKAMVFRKGNHFDELLGLTETTRCAETQPTL